MTIEIRAVTEENRADILALHVRESQTSFIETAEECLQDAEDCRHYQPAGLYVNGELVGFAMYGWFPEYDEENENGRVWLDRFLLMNVIRDVDWAGCCLMPLSAISFEYMSADGFI